MGDWQVEIVMGIGILVVRTVLRRVRKKQFERYAPRRDFIPVANESLESLGFFEFEALEFGQILSAIFKEGEDFKIWIIDQDLPPRFASATVLVLSSEILQLPQINITPKILSSFRRKHPELLKRYNIKTSNKEQFNQLLNDRFVAYLKEKNQKRFCFEAMDNRILMYRMGNRIKTEELDRYCNEIIEAFDILKEVY